MERGKTDPVPEYEASSSRLSRHQDVDLTLVSPQLIEMGEVVQNRVSNDVRSEQRSSFRERPQVAINAQQSSLMRPPQEMINPVTPKVDEDISQCCSCYKSARCCSITTVGIFLILIGLIAGACGVVDKYVLHGELLPLIKCMSTPGPCTALALLEPSSPTRTPTIFFTLDVDPPYLVVGQVLIATFSSPVSEPPNFYFNYLGITSLNPVVSYAYNDTSTQVELFVPFLALGNYTLNCAFYQIASLDVVIIQN